MTHPSPLRSGSIEYALGAFSRMLGPKGVVTDPGALAPRLRDERGLYRGEAGVLLLPGSTEEVAQLLAFCSQERIGVVPQGGNTGYCGAATPFSRAHVLLAFDRMERIRAVDVANMTMTVEAGVVLQCVQEAARENGLYFPLNMGSRGSARIGGVVSTNAGGLNALRYGVARDLVLGLEVVLADGSVISRARGLRKDNTGYRLHELFIGAEGTLGVITAVTLKLFPPLPGRATALLSARDLQTACELPGMLRAACEDNLVSFELVSPESARLAADLLEGGMPVQIGDGGVLLLIEAAAGSDERAAQVVESVFERELDSGRLVDGLLAQSLEQRARLWRFREGIPEAEKRQGGSLKHDISVPVECIGEFVRRARAEIDAITPVRYSIYGHLGDGNLHFNVLAPEGCDAQAWKIEHGERIGDTVATLAEAMHGSFSAEHGIGVLKKRELGQLRAASEIDLMHAVKQLLDPLGIMNPGKLF